MKKVIYRLQFRFEETNKTEMRDNKLNSILSSMEDIDTESPIQSPSNGTIIEIDGKDYEVKSKKISFVTEGDVVFYTTIVTLSNSSRMKNTSTDELDRIKKIMESYGKYQKKISKYDSNGDFFSI